MVERVVGPESLTPPEGLKGFRTLVPIPRMIDSPRLRLRNHEDGDVKGLVEAIDEARETLARWMPWVNEVKGFDDRLDYVRRMRARFEDPHEDLVYGIFERSGGRFLGGTGLHRINWSIPSFEIGYWLRTSALGLGYITESTRALTQSAFKTLGAARVEIRCDLANEKSANVPRRLGFVQEAILRCDSRTPDGALRDTAVFALTWRDWAQKLA